MLNIHLVVYVLLFELFYGSRIQFEYVNHKIARTIIHKHTTRSRNEHL